MNFKLRVYIFYKPYFHVSLNLKCSYQSQLSKKHNSQQHRTHSILLSFACRMLSGYKKLFCAIHDILWVRLYLFVPTIFVWIQNDFTLRKPCALVPNFYTLFEGTDGDEREEGGLRKSASSKILRLESFMLCYQIFTLAEA